MISRCYLEITNVCNLDCAFCPKHHRAAHSLSMEEFERLTDRLQGEVKFLYMHLMGEPFLHRLLPEFVRIAKAKGMTPILTTNGTLLDRKEALKVLEAQPFKVQISLHSQEGNGRETLTDYVATIAHFAKEGAERGVISVLRLWNVGGLNEKNENIVGLLRQHFAGEWEETRNGYKLAERVYLEYNRVFEWPDRDKEVENKEMFCYGLRNQVGVLVDGTVVPCCLDHEGDIPLGNLYETPLQEIIETERARAIYEGFTRHEAVEPLCRRCGWTMRS